MDRHTFDFVIPDTIYSGVRSTSTVRTTNILLWQYIRCVSVQTGNQIIARVGMGMQEIGNLNESGRIRRRLGVRMMSG